MPTRFEEVLERWDQSGKSYGAKLIVWHAIEQFIETHGPDAVFDCNRLRRWYREADGITPLWLRETPWQYDGDPARAGQGTGLAIAAFKRAKIIEVVDVVDNTDAVTGNGNHPIYGYRLLRSLPTLSPEDREALDTILAAGPESVREFLKPIEITKKAKAKTKKAKRSKGRKKHRELLADIELWFTDEVECA